MRPSGTLLQERLVLLQRYLDNLLSTKAFYTDPAFWLFVESEQFMGMVKEFGLVDKKIPEPPHLPKVAINNRFPDKVFWIKFSTLPFSWTITFSTARTSQIAFEASTWR